VFGAGRTHSNLGLGGALSSSKKFESFRNDNDEDDDFYDARGDEKTLQDMQAEMQKLEETQMMMTCRSDLAATLNHEQVPADV
jgi:cystathionine beta-lyase/cystathionine gamma-synthase